MRNHWLKRHRQRQIKHERIASSPWSDNPVICWYGVIKDIQEEEDAKAWKAIEDACGYVITMTSDDGFHFMMDTITVSLPDEMDTTED